MLILYTQTNLFPHSYLLNKYLHQTPAAVQKALLQQQNSNARIASLLGKILLKRGLEQLQPTVTHTLEQIQFTQHLRPCLPGSNIDFNLSHSGSYVICALSTHCRLGIDIEQMKAIDIDNFSDLMTPEEIAAIYRSPTPTISFYKYWTQKECVLKANGKGLYIPLNEFTVKHNQAELENQHWFLKEISIDGDYMCHLASDMPLTEIEIRQEAM